MAVEDQIQAFIDYLHNVKHTSENTELSYHRDLNKVKAYLEEHPEFEHICILLSGDTGLRR